MVVGIGKEPLIGGKSECAIRACDAPDEIVEQGQQEDDQHEQERRSRKDQRHCRSVRRLADDAAEHRRRARVLLWGITISTVHTCPGG